MPPAGGPVVMTLDIVPQEITAYDKAGTATNVTPSPTTLEDSTLGATVDQYIGWTLKITDASDAAPEGESRIVKSNTATDLVVDSNFPFTANIESGDTYALYPPPWIVRLQNAIASYAWPVVA